jgi:hypothetical protein
MPLGGNMEIVNFIYRPPNVRDSNIPLAQDATMCVKFAQNRVMLDEWWLFGGTRWSRFKFRLKHPIVYSKRGLRNLYRRIKRIFVKEPPTILCRIWKNKEETLKSFPEKDNAK